LIRSFAPPRAPRAQLAVLALSTWLLSPAAALADGGLYLGASGGYTLDSYHRADLNDALVENFAASDYTLVLHGASLHEQGTPWALEVGYRFSSYFGLEASYLELSSLRYQGAGTATPQFGGSGGKVAVNLDIKSRGPTLAFVGMLPLTNQWNLEARLGAYEGKTLTDYAASVIGASSSGVESQTSASVLASVGTQYVIAPHWVVRLDYTRLNSLGEKLLDKSFNVDLVTAGVFYAF
jgi:opacity protein-like surface antigen